MRFSLILVTLYQRGHGQKRPRPCECSLDGSEIPKLRTCGVNSEWLRTQSEKPGIEPHAIQEAVLEIDVAVKEVSLRSS